MAALAVSLACAVAVLAQETLEVAVVALAVAAVLQQTLLLETAVVEPQTQSQALL